MTRRWRPAVATFVSYALLIIAVHKDLLSQFSKRVLAGSQVGGGFVWQLWWFPKALSEGLDPFFNSFLMFPAGADAVVMQSFRFQSPLVFSLGTWLHWLSPFAAANALFLISYLASGISMYLLAARFIENELARFLAGFAFMFNHYALMQHTLGHLNECFLFFVPILFLATYCVCHRPSLRSSLFFYFCAIGISLSTLYLFFSCLLVGVPVFVCATILSDREVRRNRAWIKTFVIGYVMVFLAFIAVYGPLITQAGRLIGGTESSSLSLLSFIDFPAWHPSRWVQSLRQITSGALDQALASASGYIGAAPPLLANPENLMGFFGISLPAMLAVGAATKAFRGQKPWLVLFSIGIIFSLGPWLQLRYTETAVPMPYLFFKHMPYLSFFRTPSRMIVLSWVAAALLLGLSYETICRRFLGKLGRVALFLSLSILFSWEMGLSAIGRITTSVDPGPIDRFLAEQPGQNGLLALPVSINKAGDISINAQKSMLFAPIHGRPLVVGRPPRHTWESLSFCENTDFVYELTHPVVIAALYENPAMASRRAFLTKHAVEILKKNRIEYVLLHIDDDFFSEKTILLYRRFLDDSLGAPFLLENYRALYRIL